MRLRKYYPKPARRGASMHGANLAGEETVQVALSSRPVLMRLGRATGDDLGGWASS